VPFDDRYNQSARIDDLSKPLMQAFLQEVGSALAADAPGLSVEALARQMNVAGGPTESPWPKNVGLLFFNETPERFFPGVQIDVAWFPEGAGGDRFEEKNLQRTAGTDDARGFELHPAQLSARDGHQASRPR
jgi:ATP-dependent DNA helicase RecG